MKKTHFAILTFVVAQTIAVGEVGAVTMTFSGVNLDPFATTYSENGIVASGNGALGEFGTQVLHIDDSGTDASSSVRFTMASSFDAIGFDLRPASFDFSVCDPATGVCENKTFENVLLQGFNGANLVTSFMFNMGTGNGPYPVHLDNTFKNLTAFTISAIFPTSPGMCGAPCSHFEIDNVELAPVPLPATLPLEALGLAILALFGFRRSARRAFYQPS